MKGCDRRRSFRRRHFSFSKQRGAYLSAFSRARVGPNTLFRAAQPPPDTSRIDEAIRVVGVTRFVLVVQTELSGVLRRWSRAPFAAFLMFGLIVGPALGFVSVVN